LDNHGLTYTKRSYRAMLKRCYDNTNNRYHSHGARGIEVCPDWRDSFDNFVEDMGWRPKGMSIDRIDNDAGYYKANCRWANHYTQAANRRDSNKTVGVNWHKQHQLWRAYINKDWKQVGLGWYHNYNDAVIARKMAEFEMEVYI